MGLGADDWRVIRLTLKGGFGHTEAPVGMVHNRAGWLKPLADFILEKRRFVQGPAWGQ